MQVHLIDGTFELFRAFFGGRPAQAPDGTEVGATRTLLRNLAMLLREPGVTHVGVAFDHEIRSFRNDLYAGYKTDAGVDPALLAQFPLAEEAAAALGLVVWPMVALEADDALATFAVRAAADPRVTQVRVCTPDKDLFQVVDGERVISVDRVRGVERGATAVREKTGVSPASIPDWLALVGDTADGIPGVPRWGERSAAAILQRWGHIEAIPADPAAWDVKIRGADGLAALLAEHREAAALWKRLATLVTDAPLTEQVDDLRWRGVDWPRLQALCARLGDARFLDTARKLSPPA